MKRKIATFLFLISLVSFSQNNARMTFKESLEKASNEHKNILLYFSGSDWCAPCVKFKKNFIESDQFKSFSQDHLVVFNADFPRLKKNQLQPIIAEENESLAEKYNQKGLFPMVLLLKSNGEVIKKWEQLPTETIDEFITKLN